MSCPPLFLHVHNISLFVSLSVKIKHCPSCTLCYLVLSDICPSACKLFIMSAFMSVHTYNIHPLRLYATLCLFFCLCTALSVHVRLFVNNIVCPTVYTKHKLSVFLSVHNSVRDSVCTQRSLLSGCTQYCLCV